MRHLDEPGEFRTRVSSCELRGTQSRPPRRRVSNVSIILSSVSSHLDARRTDTVSLVIDMSRAGEPPPTLHHLVRSRIQERGWSYTDLERRSGHALSRGRWQQLGSGAPQRKFPDPASLMVIAQVLEVDITTVVLASARAVGLDARLPGSDLAHLLPPGTDQLSTRMRDAILALIRAAVAESDIGESSSDRSGVTVEWPKADAPSLQHDSEPAQRNS